MKSSFPINEFAMPMPSSKIVLLVKRYSHTHICIHMNILMERSFPKHFL